MAVDLTPRQPKKAYGDEGGAYYEWCPADLPMLGLASIGAAKLSLAAGGLALPSYSDSAKVAYVLQGKGTCGVVLPEATKEKVLAVKEGDALALPFGVVTWWHNTPEATTELVVLFLGDTSKGHKAGQFTNFQLTGANGIFTGFSTEFVGRAWDLPQEDAAKLVSSQPAAGIVKLKAGQKLPEPSPKDREGMALNCLEAPLDVDIKNGGRVVVLNTQNLPLVKEVGLGADLVRIDAHSMCSPGFSCGVPHTSPPNRARHGGRPPSVSVPERATNRPVPDKTAPLPSFSLFLSVTPSQSHPLLLSVLLPGRRTVMTVS